LIGRQGAARWRCADGEKFRSAPTPQFYKETADEWFDRYANYDVVEAAVIK